MKLLIPDYSISYQLLDSGNGLKLEQFGQNRIIRPDSNCLWAPKLPVNEWNKADACYGTKGWETKKSFKEPWTITYPIHGDSPIGVNKITLSLRFFSNEQKHWAFPRARS